MRRLVAILVAIWSASVIAGPDWLGLGDGHLGAGVFTSGATVINTSAVLTAPASPGDRSVSLSSSLFQPGQLVLLVQIGGALDAGSGTTASVDLAAAQIGQWELARVSSVNGVQLVLSDALADAFSPPGAQVISVPEYTTLTVSAGASLVAPPWNGTTGGVLALLVQDNVQLDGALDATGRGFNGGPLVNTVPESYRCQALDGTGNFDGGARKGEGLSFDRFGASGRGNVLTAGGGGDCDNSGGGGGGNGTPGGDGGWTLDAQRAVGGFGGVAVMGSVASHLTLGGGGGAGEENNAVGSPGGNGGGILFLRAGSISGAGRLLADGLGPNLAQATEDGAGGGGAGGTVLVRVVGPIDCAVLSASGGDGGWTNSAVVVVSTLHGPGGGGGAGRVLFQADGGTCPLSVTSGVGGRAVQRDGGTTDYGARPLSSSTGPITVLPGGFHIPPAPIILMPANNAVLDASTIAVTGAAEAGDAVYLFADQQNPLTTVADSDGGFSFTLLQVAAGSHVLSAGAVLQNIGGPRTQVAFTVMIDGGTTTDGGTGTTDGGTPNAAIQNLAVGCDCRAGAWPLFSLALAGLSRRRAAKPNRQRDG